MNEQERKSQKLKWYKELHKRKIYDEVSEWMTQERRRLRAPGSSKRDDDTAFAVWEAMAKKFLEDGEPVPAVVKEPPPPPPPGRKRKKKKKAPPKPDPPRIEDVSGDQLALFEGVSTPNLAEDARWVAQHLSNPAAEEIVKTPSALSMLRWARQSPDKFYQMLGSRILPKEERQEEDDEYKPSKEEKRSIAKMKDIWHRATDHALKTGTGVLVQCQQCGLRQEVRICDIKDK